jgi:hypothetical protein
VRKNTGQLTLQKRRALVSVRRKFESNESFMIQRGGLILEGAADVDERKSRSIRP